jgi:hypothetical protein
MIRSLGLGLERDRKTHITSHRAFGMANWLVGVAMIRTTVTHRVANGVGVQKCAKIMTDNARMRIVILQYCGIIQDKKVQCRRYRRYFVPGSQSYLVRGPWPCQAVSRGGNTGRKQ